MRAAIIGAGQIARQHLSCVRKLPGVDVVAVCDRSPSVAEAAAERFEVGTWYTDHRTMLEETRPDVVHVTTPPPSHPRLAIDSLDAGSHVIVEKPASSTLDELEAMVQRASDKKKILVENYNYVFNRGTREILQRVEAGEFGAVTHVDVMICLDILGPSGFADPNLPHPALSLAGGAIADFLPHLASLAQRFIGRHLQAHSTWTKRSQTVLPYDEFHAIVEGEKATATLGFSGNSKPDGCWVRVYGERAQATANIWETRVTFNKVRNAPRPLNSVINGLEEGSSVQASALGTFLRKFGRGPGTYDGLFELLTRTYEAIQDGTLLPVTPGQMLEVNRLIDDLKPRAQA